MCSFQRLPTATRLLPGDLVMIPPESGRNRRMRLAPESLRRKYGFRYGLFSAMYLGSTEGCLRSIFYAEADSPRWLLVDRPVVTCRGGDSDELMAANTLAPSDPYPAVSHIRVIAVPNGASAASLAFTALCETPNLSRYRGGDLSRLLPRSPAERALAAETRRRLPALAGLGKTNEIQDLLSGVSKVSREMHGLLGDDYDNLAPLDFDGSSFPSKDSTPYEVMQYVSGRLPVLDMCLPCAYVPIKFFRDNPEISAYRMTDDAAAEAATAVVDAVFTRIRESFSAAAATVQCVTDALSAKRRKLLYLLDDAPEATGDPHQALDAPWRCDVPAGPSYDAPHTAVRRIREAAEEVAA